MKRIHTYCNFCDEDTNGKYITVEINGVPDPDKPGNLETHACYRCFDVMKVLVALHYSDKKLIKLKDAYYVFA